MCHTNLQVYTFSGGRLKVADKKFSNLKCDYEITFDPHSLIQEVKNGNDNIKMINYQFQKIDKIANMDINTNVDVIACVKSVSDVSEIVSKKLGGALLHKREVTVFDDSGYEIRVTLWGEKVLDMHAYMIYIYI